MARLRTSGRKSVTAQHSALLSSLVTVTRADNLLSRLCSPVVSSRLQMQPLGEAWRGISSSCVCDKCNIRKRNTDAHSIWTSKSRHKAVFRHSRRSLPVTFSTELPNSLARVELLSSLLNVVIQGLSGPHTMWSLHLAPLVPSTLPPLRSRGIFLWS